MAAQLEDTPLLARLVSFHSVSRNSNLPIADFICDYLDHPRIEIFRNYNSDRTKVNLIARTRPLGSTTKDRTVSEGADRGGLVLSGHMDVVPAEEPQWKSDPFALIETEEALFARGACDMKGFVALAMNRMRRFADRQLHQPLVLILTFDEELGTLGAQHLQKTWHQEFPLPRHAIVGEPTSLRVVRMHKGHTKMKVAFAGKGAHSGYPHLGVNAIEPAGRAVVALSDLRRKWEGERATTSGFFPEVPFVAMNIGRINGGTVVNVVPERCEIELGFRALPGMEAAPLIQRVFDTIRQATPGDDVCIDVIGDTPPFLTGKETRVYQALCDLTGQKDCFGVSYASDAGPLSQMGMECVLFGPGTIEVAHQPNEWLPRKEFVNAGQVLERAVQALCGPVD